MRVLKKFYLLILVFITMNLMACRSNIDEYKTENNATPTVPSTASVPTVLPTQPEPDDKGELITYTVSSALSSNMVLQMNSHINVWGWSEQTGGIIYVEFMGEKRYGVVNDEGEWLVQLSPHDYTTEGQTMRIYPKNGEVTEFTDILIGNVYIIAGQSNAELPLSKCISTTPDLQISEDDNIRFFVQNRSLAILDEEKLLTPQANTVNKTMKWYKTSSERITGNCSALGYYFAKELTKSTDIPIGIMMTAAGGALLRELMPVELANSFGYYDKFNVPMGGYYNTLMHPFLNMKFKSMIFYQGEAESYGYLYTDEYGIQMKAYIEELRKRFGFDFTLYYVQLSSHGQNGAREWPRLPDIRILQESANISNSYVIASYDAGSTEGYADWAHPIYKSVLGERIANIALAVEYGIKDKQYTCSPTVTNVKWEDQSCVLTFDNIGDGLKLAVGDTAKGFMIKTDGKWVERTAEITGSNEIRVFYGNGVDKKSVTAVSYAYFQLSSVKTANICSSTEVPALAFLRNKN